MTPDTNKWLNYSEIARTTNDTINKMIPFARKINTVHEWKNGNMYHLTGEYKDIRWDTKEKFSYKKKCELFAVTQHRGAMSIVMFSELLYSHLKEPIYTIDVYECVREAYNEEYDDGKDTDRQKEVLDILMEKGHKGDFRFEHLNSEPEYVDVNRIWGCNVNSKIIDTINLKEYHTGGSNLDVSNITKYYDVLEDINLISLYIEN